MAAHERGCGVRPLRRVLPDRTIGFASGFNAVGAILRSDDGGVSWQPQLSNSTFRLEDVFFTDAQRGWAVGANGTIVHTVTGGLP